MTENLLEVKNLSVIFKRNNQSPFIAVDNIAFSLKKGEVLGMVGESGSGKSVTALSVLGLLPQGKAEIADNSSIRFNGEELIGAPEQDLRQIRGGQIGFIFQEPMSSLNPLHRVGKKVAENLLMHQKITIKQAKRQTIKLLKLAGIKNPAVRFNAYPHELSGGQRQRVMIAMAIANNPQILIADEPTTALDVTIQEQIINLLLDLKNKFNMSVLFISHDLRLVRKIADKIIVMKNGKIVESGRAEDIFLRPQNDYTKKLISSFNLLKTNRKTAREQILKADNIIVSYPLEKNFWGRVTKRLFAVNNVSLKLYQGQTLGIVGESGSGKTTLGMCLANMIKFNGTIKLADIDIKSREFRKNVQIVFQDPYDSLNPRLNVLEIIAEGLKVHFPRLQQTEIKQKVIAMLSEVGLSANDLYKYPHEFSGGQRQRIAIARALIVNPKLVILDEPTSALDVTIQAQIIDLLIKLQQKYNMAYVFISHDMRVVQTIADNVAVMKDGQIIEQGATDAVFKKPQSEYAKTLIKASLL